MAKQSDGEPRASPMKDVYPLLQPTRSGARLSATLEATMQRSPYAPPKAEVRDFGPDSAPLQKPKQVIRAVTLLWVSLSLGVIVFLLDLRFVQATAPGPAVWLIPIAVLGLLAFLIVSISSGRNWARIVFLVMFVLGALPYLLALTDMFSRSVITGSVSTAQFLLQAIAMYLVFTHPGSTWFRQRK